MIGSRSLYSLAQFLELQELQFVVVLLAKHGARASVQHDEALTGILGPLREMDEHNLMQLLGEVIATQSDLRARVSPRYRFDERMHDLEKCLALDGYAIAKRTLLSTDPSIPGAQPVEDDLVLALRRSRLRRSAEIIEKIEDSAQAFRKSPPDYNAALTNARVALETLAADFAGSMSFPKPPSFDDKKWGRVIEYLRLSGKITPDEEQGLTGVYRFLSPGAHRPVAIPEEQMARLGRSFALNMCWFLVQTYLV